MSDKILNAPYIPTAKAGSFTARLGKSIGPSFQSSIKIKGFCGIPGMMT